MINSLITGTGAYIPKQKVLNRDYESYSFYRNSNRIESSKNATLIEHISAVSGIRERRIANSEETTSFMAAKAASRAITNAGIDEETLDYIIVAHNTGEVSYRGRQTEMLPNLASRVKHAIGIVNPNCVAYDVVFGCPGWILGLIQADYYIKSGDTKKILVIGSDNLTRITDLRNYDCLFDNLMETNLFGTERLMKLCDQLDVKEFCYVSTAYACGQSNGIISPECTNIREGYRSNYEMVKMLGEQRVKARGKKTGNRIRIFRPSSVCGRLMEKPYGMIPKFDIFYYWGVCLLKMKMKYYKIPYEDRYSKKIDRPFRVKNTEKAGLNIVPVDYCAKLMYHICDQDAPGDSFNLVHHKETLHEFHLNQSLKSINLEGMVHVSEIPQDPDHFETAYYKTAGHVFDDYMNAEPIHFDTSQLDDVRRKAGIKCPEMNESNFNLLLDFAKKRDFGLRLN